MKVISVIASPRKSGNCSSIVKRITEGLNDNNHSNSIYYIDEMNISPCQGCKSCKPLEGRAPSKCIINDDFLKVISELEKSDALIFAAPNYFSEINAQGKIFMDRFYSMTKKVNKKLLGKKCIIIFTYGAPMGSCDKYIYKRSKIFESIGLDVIEIMSIGNNIPTSNHEKTEEVMDIAYNIGLNL